MAERRMFSKSIIDSDDFLDLPLAARLLYYDLGMRADDDGFVNSPKKITRMVGATAEDLQILCRNRFIAAFESGVVGICHWKQNNYIQKDRYTPTKYQRELQELQALGEEGHPAGVGVINRTGARVLERAEVEVEAGVINGAGAGIVERTGVIHRAGGLERTGDSLGPCIQSVSTLDTQDRVGKDKDREELGEESERAGERFGLTPIPPGAQGAAIFSGEKKRGPSKKEAPKERFGEFRLVELTGEEHRQLTERLGKGVAESYITRLDGYLASTGKRYKSHYATLLAWQRRDGEKGIPSTGQGAGGKSKDSFAGASYVLGDLELRLLKAQIEGT